MFVFTTVLNLMFSFSRLGFDSASCCARSWFGGSGRPFLFLLLFDCSYYLVTDGLADKHPQRVRDFPPDETSILGVGLGFSQAGLTPIVEMPYENFGYFWHRGIACSALCPPVQDSCATQHPFSAAALATH